jgi:hypothetical protein
MAPQSTKTPTPPSLQVFLFDIERYIHPTPTYVPTGTKFEGQSTNKTDYLSPGKIVRVADFAPRNTYVPKADDRDFLSTTRGQHDPKPLPKCAAVEWMNKPREIDTNGHVHLAKQPLVQPNSQSVAAQ